MKQCQDELLQARSSAGELTARLDASNARFATTLGLYGSTHSPGPTHHDIRIESLEADLTNLRERSSNEIKLLEEKLAASQKLASQNEQWYALLSRTKYPSHLCLHPPESSSLAQNELSQKSESLDRLQALYDTLLISEASCRIKAESLAPLKSEVQTLRIYQSQAETIPSLRSQIDALLSSNAEYKARVAALEDERTEVARLRGAELRVLTLTETASDLQKRVDDVEARCAVERDGRIKAEALRESLAGAWAAFEVETKEDVKKLQERCVRRDVIPYYTANSASSLQEAKVANEVCTCIIVSIPRLLTDFSRCSPGNWSSRKSRTRGITQTFR